MGKSTKKKNKKITAPKANIQELSISRDGGQIALRGYSYQFLYSCYLILSSSNPSNFFQLEGIEDIDCIMQKNGSNDITHIQLKYSVNKQDASFLTDVLKNFLEAYLLDQNRFFKLVYDFPVAKGHLSKIFASKLDEKSRTHWAGVISNIKKNNPSWNWSVYDFDKFISHLSFEKIEKSILATEIEKTLIRIYEINTDNVSLFANSIKILCFEKMEQRAYVTKAELDSKIQSVKIDISKGPQNPAHSWIRKLDYYPIIVGNFDMASESNLTEWLLGCIAFADAPFDYLVILSANESKEIDSTALQFPRRMLVDVKKAIESENHSLLDKLVPPYPVNVTAQMLDCFSEKYDLPEKKVTDVDELPIGYIAEELWIYSKSVELLTEPEDACYLAAQTQDIQLNITEMLCLLKNKLPVKDVDWLIEICDNVFSGEKFDDIMFNNVIEHFIQKKIEQ